MLISFDLGVKLNFATEPPGALAHNAYLRPCRVVWTHNVQYGKCRRSHHTDASDRPRSKRPNAPLRERPEGGWPRRNHAGATVIPFKWRMYGCQIAWLLRCNRPPILCGDDGTKQDRPAHQKTAPISPLGPVCRARRDRYEDHTFCERSRAWTFDRCRVRHGVAEWGCPNSSQPRLSRRDRAAVPQHWHGPGSSRDLLGSVSVKPDRPSGVWPEQHDLAVWTFPRWQRLTWGSAAIPCVKPVGCYRHNTIRIRSQTVGIPLSLLTRSR
jgi:hypothetical protein